MQTNSNQNELEIIKKAEGIIELFEKELKKTKKPTDAYEQKVINHLLNIILEYRKLKIDKDKPFPLSKYALLLVNAYDIANHRHVIEDHESVTGRNKELQNILDSQKEELKKKNERISELEKQLFKYEGILEEREKNDIPDDTLRGDVDV